MLSDWAKVSSFVQNREPPALDDRAEFRRCIMIEPRPKGKSLAWQRWFASVATGPRAGRGVVSGFPRPALTGGRYEIALSYEDRRQGPMPQRQRWGTRNGADGPRSGLPPLNSSAGEALAGSFR
ncbi:MAG: hypothetical protein AMXMBFR83_20840 [Phycisphaerae bacterium]